VRVVSWNMNHWQPSRSGAMPPAEAWDHLRSRLKADVALVQGAGLPTEFEGADSRGFDKESAGRPGVPGLWT
jgi:hypothetical protein